MADTPKKASKKAPAKSAASKPASKPASKSVPVHAPKKAEPSLGELRAEWGEAQEATAYRERRVNRAKAMQSSIADRKTEIAYANALLREAREAEAEARDRFISAKSRKEALA